MGAKSVPGVNFRQVITSFTGVRASVAGGDFIIKMSDKVDGFVHVAGIDSPGLTCCVSIAKYVLDILKDAGVQLAEKENWNGTREDMHAFAKMSIEEKNEANKQMDETLSKINVLAENYPDLKASENFKTLQDSITDVEEHLQAARRLYNANISSYNQMIVTFPISIIAGTKGLTKREFFVAEEHKKQDVEIKF